MVWPVKAYVLRHKSKFDYREEVSGRLEFIERLYRGDYGGNRSEFERPVFQLGHSTSPFELELYQLVTLWRHSLVLPVVSWLGLRGGISLGAVQSTLRK